MSILLLKGNGEYCKLIDGNTYELGTFPEDEELREHATLELLKDEPTVIDVAGMSVVNYYKVWRKYGNGRGSTDEPVDFVQAMIDFGGLFME